MSFEASLRTSKWEPIETSAPTTWTLALAGGEGIRLADYVERRFGKRMPKQYCTMLGKRSMLAHTLERTTRITPADRTLTVIGTHHAAMALPQLDGLSDHVFRQPSSRGTGMALYVALAMIRRWTPNAVVTITPTDHYVAPATAYVEQLQRAKNVATRLGDRVVILGVKPVEADSELGYLTVGEKITDVPEVRQLTTFVEKPTASQAEQLIHAGALWNTMVTCGTVTALWELGRAADPRLIDILDSLVPLIGTSDEDDGIEYVYDAYLPVNFSRDILEQVPSRTCALELTDVEWSDWGKPERIETVLNLRRARAMQPVRVGP